MTTSLQFLSGGGEMGALMRAYNWQSSPIGPADKWPQNLRTTLGILLNSKFPMFLYWGPDLVCFYNDAYRFSLGNDGKHPLILGMKGEEAWKDTWYLLKPSIDQVIYEGEATWSEDQLIPIYREGEMKDAYWTFSFSPVKNESNKTAGVFLTLIETTGKVNNLKKLIEANDQLAFAIEATELGTFDLNPVTNKFIGNNRLKDWFGLPHYMEVDLTLAINVMVEKDRSRVANAIQKTLQYESGGLYDIEYSILNPVTKQERIVRAKGRAWFRDDKTPYRFNGTLQDITEQSIARRKTEISEAKFRNLILQAPVLINTLIGDSFIVDTINVTALQIWGKTYEEVINKPLFDSSPELEASVKKILNNVYLSGDPFIANEIPVELKRTGMPETAYFNMVYQPLRDLDNKIYGIIVIGTEVTETVNARKQIEASEKRFSNILSQSVMAIGILKGADMVIESVNEPLLKIWRKGPDIVGKPLFEVISELKSQQFSKQLNDVYTTGIAYTYNENRAIILNNGKPEERFFSVVMQPYTEVNGTISGVTVIGTETTDQVMAKKQIEESEARFRNLIWQAPVLVATYRGPTFIIETVNKSAILAWGKSYEELINKPLFEVSPELEEGLKTILNDIYTTGESFINNEIAVEIIRTGKPSMAYFNMLYQPLRDLDNNIYAIMLIGTEVTESVNARKQIEASGEFNRTVLESSPDCLKVIDIEGRIQFMNFNGLYQMEIDDFSTFKNKNWFSLWGSENEALAKASIDKALTGATAQFTALSVTAKGTPKWWDVVVSPVVKPGEQVQQIISVSRDITEKKKAEEAIENMAAYLKLATDSANVGTWSLNIQTQELEWSALHKKIWGYNEQNKNLTYEDWHKAIVPEDLALAFQKIDESKVNNSIYEVDYRIKRANDGAVVWIKSRGQYQYDELGVANKLTGISIDISQQKMFSEALEHKVNERTEELAFKSTELEEMVQKLALKNIELEHSNSELKSFTYIAGHDLQEPLRKIQIFGKLINNSEKFSDKTQDYFNRIIAASAHMQNLIVSLLDFSRVDADKLIIVPCNLGTIVEESKNELNLIILEKKAIIEHDNLPTINGSHIQLCQLFTNLISNALKYSRPEIIPHITILSELVDGKQIEHPSANKQKEYYAIKITDNGIGFKNEYATKIFELFQRLHSKSVYSGTGIGLAIVKKIAINHNGFMVAEGKPGIGSTFTFYVPTL